MKQKQEVRRVQGRERRFQYILTRKSVKNLNMRVKPDGTISCFCKSSCSCKVY